VLNKAKRALKKNPKNEFGDLAITPCGYKSQIDPFFGSLSRQIRQIALRINSSLTRYGCLRVMLAWKSGEDQIKL